MSISIHHLPSIRLLASALEASSPVQSEMSSGFTSAGGLGELFAEKDAALANSSGLNRITNIQMPSSLQIRFENAFETKTRKVRPDRKIYEKSTTETFAKNSQSIAAKLRTGLARRLRELSDFLNPEGRT